MTNKKGQELLQKIIDDLENNGIITNTLVEDLKALRPYAVEEKRPLVAKVLRLSYEHIEDHDTFAIPIPVDDEIYDEETEEFVEVTESEDNYDAKKSLLYLMNLVKYSDHKHNKPEIREYNEALKAYEELD